MRSFEAIIESCSFQKDGFAAPTAETFWRLGAVCIIKGGEESYIAVQKAIRTDEAYEFSGLWSFPGGMVRCHESINSSSGRSLKVSDVLTSLALRIAAEAGIDRGALQEFELFSELKPLVSSYTAKGEKRYTLIIPFRAELSDSISPMTSDASIMNAQAVRLSSIIPLMSPASSVYAMQCEAISSSTIARTDSMETCKRWALEAGFR